MAPIAKIIPEAPARKRGHTADFGPVVSRSVAIPVVMGRGQIMGSIIPHEVYGQIVKIAHDSGDPSEAHRLAHQFMKDLAKARRLDAKERQVRFDKLRTSLIHTRKTDTRADPLVIDEALSALAGETEPDGFLEDRR
jgi:hypothetical protein